MSTLNDRREAWWAMHDARVVSIIERRWSEFYSEVVGGALGECEARMQDQMDDLARTLVAIERKLDALHAEVAIKPAVEEVARSVEDAKQKMPELERELKADLRKLHRQLDATQAAVDPAQARWADELKAVNRKLAATRAHMSVLDYSLRQRERDETKQQADEHLRQERAERQAQLEKQLADEAAKNSRPRFGMTPEVAEFLAGKPAGE